MISLKAQKVQHLSAINIIFPTHFRDVSPSPGHKTGMTKTHNPYTTAARQPQSDKHPLVCVERENNPSCRQCKEMEKLNHFL